MFIEDIEDCRWLLKYIEIKIFGQQFFSNGRKYHN